MYVGAQMYTLADLLPASHAERERGSPKLSSQETNTHTHTHTHTGREREREREIDRERDRERDRQMISHKTKG